MSPQRSIFLALLLLCCASDTPSWQQRFEEARACIQKERERLSEARAELSALEREALCRVGGWQCSGVGLPVSELSVARARVAMQEREVARAEKSFQLLIAQATTAQETP